MALEQDYTMHAGDTFKINVTINDAAGIAINLAGAEAYFALALSPGEESLLTKAEGDGITFTDEANGKLQILLSDNDTSDIAPRKYAHELKIVLAGEKDTVLYGYINILQSIIK